MKIKGHFWSVKKKIPSFLKNKFVLAGGLFLVWVSFFSPIDLFYIIGKRFELGEIKVELTKLQAENQRIRQDLHELSSNTANLEKFARENFYMKRENEEVYIFKERAN
jgi:cell division protein FtsB